MRWYPLILLAASGSLTPAHAESLPDWLKVDGFGTIGILHADDPIATVRTDGRNSSGAQNETRYDQDSVLGLQLTVRPEGPFNAGFQLISKKNSEATHRPRVQWAYLGWEPNSSVHMKVGRAVAPVFALSDVNDVHYSQITAQPPNSVYANNSVTYNDGLTGTWEHTFGSDKLTVEGYAGKTNIDTSRLFIDVPRQVGLSLSWNRDALTLRGGYSYARAVVGIPPGGTIDQFFKITRAAQGLGLCSNCEAFIDHQLKLNGTTNHVSSLGLTWDDGANVVQAEWAQRTSDSAILSGSAGWYVTLARRWGAFTPYLMFSAIKPVAEPINLKLTPPAQPTASQTAILNALAGANASNFTGQFHRQQQALGLRWDLYRNLALKLQWDTYKIDNPLWGSATVVTFPQGPQSKFDGRVNTYSLNLDFLF